ncbi:hypothetical protein N7448_004107 [Penicillium atrosanguineum]|uniref:Actin-like ATPase domain-containing protein n=1 Tax=Penicillium atrosanguineum TaxID=1132637 RepID=A0A9W9Q0K3_9EURO|nr:hypothetical protein N7526_011271 [Penicillium atrosanguineum]KAJ5140699.1 hypothetical protein N7448_004107 [Penicillium atrosanguineum]KAJ5316132.1 hypothetical protein N7476_006439 [Penicillium atrosanguineum]
MSDKEVVVLEAESWDEWVPDIVTEIFNASMDNNGSQGVAYSSAPEWLPPKTIQRWPGKLPGELANKVPTCIEYDSEFKSVINWGFKCDPEDKSSNIKEFFKLHLAPQYQDEYPEAPSRHDAQRWFQDYIQCIYQHVVSHFNSSIPQFASRNVEFLFSVPTTWKDVRMVEETRRLLERAINAKTSNHRASIGLTEAEAAAVYAGNEHYHVDDTILVCDAGGGTTDVNVLKLISSRGEPTRLEQLGHVEGQPIGSVFIDRKIHQLICERLEKVKEHIKISPSEAAWKMTSGRFQRLKCAFGTEATLTPWLKLDVPFLDPNMDLPEAEISNGQMRIAWDYVKHCFDVKADEICDLLDGHINQMHTKYPYDQIAYLILSGGFGSSPYVRKCLLERYSGPSGHIHPNAEGMQVLLADEPQLVVVHGLVLDRIQQIKRGVVTFGSRCSPVSYGIICDKIYDPENHVGQLVRLDPRDNKTFAVDQVDWLVIQGNPIPYTGVRKEFQLKMDPGRENGPWKVQIVMSTLPPDRLPRNMSQSGVYLVCSLDIATDNVDKKLKNRHWYSRKPTFWRTTFDVKVVVGPADLSFQLWSKDRRIRSNKHEPIAVKWMPSRDFEEEPGVGVS